MKGVVKFWPAAVEDVRQAYDWYERQRAGLGREFVEAVDETLKQIELAPERFAKANRRAREAIVKRFPFAIYFVSTKSTIDVVSILHSSRDPSEWKNRLRK